jgi:hypothetical protein
MVTWGDSVSPRVACAVLVLAIGACAGASATSAVISPELLTEARTRGVARSIVELRVPAGAGEAAIAVTKRRVLARIAGTRHQVLRDLPGFPMLVLDASEATLQVLAHSPDVLRVNGERIDRPQR